MSCDVCSQFLFISYIVHKLCETISRFDERWENLISLLCPCIPVIRWHEYNPYSVMPWLVYSFLVIGVILAYEWMVKQLNYIAFNTCPSPFSYWSLWGIRISVLLWKCIVFADTYWPGFTLWPRIKCIIYIIPYMPFIKNRDFWFMHAVKTHNVHPKLAVSDICL